MTKQVYKATVFVIEECLVEYDVWVEAHSKNDAEIRVREMDWDDAEIQKTHSGEIEHVEEIQTIEESRFPNT